LCFLTIVSDSKTDLTICCFAKLDSCELNMASIKSLSYRGIKKRKGAEGLDNPNDVVGFDEPTNGRKTFRSSSFKRFHKDSKIWASFWVKGVVDESMVVKGRVFTISKKSRKNITPLNFPSKSL